MKPLLVVDGYNVIGAWREAERRGWSMDQTRDRLRLLLEDHAGYTGEEVVLVFDGYQSDRRVHTIERFGHLTQVFTIRDETADSYIERLVAQTPRYRTVRVATSDGLEQSQVLATGATRLTSQELLIELEHTRRKGMEAHDRERRAVLPSSRIGGRLPEETLRRLEQMRRGK